MPDTLIHALKIICRPGCAAEATDLENINQIIRCSEHAQERQQAGDLNHNQERMNGYSF